MNGKQFSNEVGQGVAEYLIFLFVVVILLALAVASQAPAMVAWLMTALHFAG